MDRVRLLVVCSEMCWSLESLQADLVMVQDSEIYSAAERRYKEVSINSILQLLSLAHGNPGKAVIMCHSRSKDFIAKFVQEPGPLESTLHQNLHDLLAREAAAGNIESMQDCLDLLGETFLYHRIAHNPNFYEITERTPDHINDFLSELVEDTV